MKLLITGATGLVGSSIVQHCLNKGIEVNYLSTRRNALESKPGYRGFLWDPSEKQIDLECFDGVSAIINLAGASIAKRWTPKRKQLILSSRINSLRTLGHGLEQLDSISGIHLLTASAIGIYPSSQTEYYEENTKKVDSSFLGEVVTAWENEADALGRLGIDVAKIRLGTVLSTQGGALPKMAQPIKYYGGAAFGSGEQWQSWIHIDDLARIFLFAITHKLTGVYNGVAPNPVTNNKLIRETASALNKPVLLPNIPQSLLKLLLGEMSYILMASQRVCSKKIENEGFEFRYPNICRALKELYSPANTAAHQTEQAQ